MATTADRDARLNDLSSSLTAFINQRRDELNNRVAVTKQILKGRTGSERLAQSAVQGVQPLVVASLDNFLKS